MKIRKRKIKKKLQTVKNFQKDSMTHQFMSKRFRGQFESTLAQAPKHLMYVP